MLWEFFKYFSNSHVELCLELIRLIFVKKIHGPASPHQVIGFRIHQVDDQCTLTVFAHVYISVYPILSIGSKGIRVYQATIFQNYVVMDF